MADERCAIWAKWLAVYRYGGDREVRRRVPEQTREFREQVLDRPALAEGETLLDVGCGEGLIGLGALERGAGRVIFSDISDDLLGFGFGAPGRRAVLGCLRQHVGQLPRGQILQ